MLFRSIMNFASSSLAAAKKVAPFVLVCAGAFATNMAHAGWLAQFLCSGDNDPKLCMSHFSLNIQSAPQPVLSDRVVARLNEAARLKGAEKIAFVEKNSAVFLVAPSATAVSFLPQNGGQKTVLAGPRPTCSAGVWAGPEGKGGCTPGLPDVLRK